MPSLNTAAYVREALESVSNQTFADLEVLCVDAGSTDGTRETIVEFAKQDGRFKLVDSPVKSYGAQMNLGLKAAHGEYIGIVEPDDWVEPDMYSTLLGVAEDQGLDFVKANVLKFTGRGASAKSGKVSLLEGCSSLYGRTIDVAEHPEVTLAPMLATWAGIYRKSFLDDAGFRYHETPGASYQDVALYVASLAFARRCCFLDDAFYHYRQDNASASSARKDGAGLLREEYKYVWETCLSSVDERRLSVLRPYLMALQFAGEAFTARRLPSQERRTFWEGFRADFIDAYRRGEFRRDLMPAGHWVLLRRVMNGEGSVGLLERMRVCLAENGVLGTLNRAWQKLCGNEDGASI